VKNKKIRVVFIFLFFTAYFLLAARPVPLETVLSSAWVSSLDTEDSQAASLSAKTASSGQLLPFTLGSRFGYVDTSGQFTINKIKTGNIYLSGNFWTEYGAQPSNIEIKNQYDELLIDIEKTSGYPILLDNRIFILGSEQNELSEIDSNGNVLWTYEYGAPITCIDAAVGLVLTGSLDGVIEILDSYGKRIFHFAPGGSHYEVILGCAISKNGSRLGIISGIDSQRFLYLERFGNTGGEYRVVYHETLETGFRRPVRILFIDEDRRIIFEQAGGVNCYNIKSRHGIFIPLGSGITAVDNSGGQGLLFLITSDSRRRNELIGIKLPEDKIFALPGNNNTREMIFLKASFISDDVFLERTGSRLIVGGGTVLISFDMEKK
jgi:hypothetical protein